MNKEGKVSKVAICEQCQGYILACHIDFLSNETEKEFTKLSNEGFTVKLETIAETKSREFGNYNDCKVKQC